MGVFDFIGLPSARTSDLLNPAKWLSDWAGGGRVSAGVPVTPEGAMALSAYYAGIRIIAEDIGKLPWGVELVTGAEDGLPTVRPARDHALDRLVRTAPNREMTSQAFRELMIAWALGWGNGRAEIQRDYLGNPIALWPIHPGLIKPWRDPETWKLWYQVRPFGTFEGGLLPLEDVFDVHGVGPDGITGYSLAQLARQDISTGLAQVQFAGSVFANGGVKRVVLRHPKKITDAELTRMRSQWRKSYGTGTDPANLGHPIILEGGMEMAGVTINPVDAEMVASSRETVVTIARWFRLPPHKLAALDRATFSNIEHLSLEYVQDTLLAWGTRLEGEAERKLFLEQDVRAGYCTRLDLEALLRGDHKTLTEGIRTQIATGVMTPNEGRAKLRRNPSTVKGSNDLWQQGAMRTLETLAATPPPAAGPSGSAPSDPSGDDPAKGTAADDGEDPKDAGADPAPPPPPADPAAARRTARVAAGARAARLVAPALSDACARLARREVKALEKPAVVALPDRELRGAVATWAAGERAPALELLSPVVSTLVRTAAELAVPGLQAAGPGPDLAVDAQALVGVVVDAYLAAQPDAAVARKHARKVLEPEAAGSELSAGILHAFELALSR